MKAIGIDLTGSEKRPSGVALLDNRKLGKGPLGGTRLVATNRLYTTYDIITFVRHFRPDVVSIDCPLSLPEDPAKIYRDCELALKRRGIGVYWCLLPSMKNLTMRGIRLAEDLRELRIEVIESYPGTGNGQTLYELIKGRGFLMLQEGSSQ